MRNAYLDALDRRGIRVQFYDPEAEHYSLPTFPWRAAPEGYSTMRQLRAQGLRPGGQDPTAQVLWRHHEFIRVAYLYDVQKALPKRIATPAQQAAIQKALAARRTCPSCQTEQDYYLSRSLGECNSCHFSEPSSDAEHDGWEAEAS